MGNIKNPKFHKSFNKVIILGPSGSGKSSIIRKLSKENLFKRNIDVDEEIVKLNNNKWPESEAEIDMYMSTINGDILLMDEVLFVTSWLELEDMKAFVQNEFIIIELYVSYEILYERKLKRDGRVEKRFKKNFETYMDIIEQAKALGLVSYLVNGMQDLDLVYRDIEVVVER